MDNELKQKITASVKEYLTAHGWPEKVNDDQIIQNLPNIWKKLESEGLLKDPIEKGLNYRIFVDIALQTRAKCDAMRHMNIHFRKNPR